MCIKQEQSPREKLGVAPGIDRRQVTVKEGVLEPRSDRFSEKRVLVSRDYGLTIQSTIVTPNQ